MSIADAVRACSILPSSARPIVRAKRIVVSKVGSVGRGEQFDDDVGDPVFLRLRQ